MASQKTNKKKGARLVSQLRLFGKASFCRLVHFPLQDEVFARRDVAFQQCKILMNAFLNSTLKVV